ncbi:MAG: molybdopterin molybdotransferase MoeA, partial [Sphingomonadales bacterium]
MISLDEALAIVCAEARPLGTEAVPVIEARRRTLAEPVIAGVDSPPADVSAMDGYALRDAELADGRTRFAVAGESFPGAGFAGAAGPGECVRIFTGAPIPQGLDRVVIQENVRRDGDVAVIETMPSASRHIRARGSDFTTGEILLKAGRLLDARALVAAAGADLDTVTVWRRPQIAVLGTGDEVVEPGRAKTTPGAIPESLSPGVAALAADWGGALAVRYRLRDDPALIERVAAEALESADLLVVTGGASVGEKDFAK